MRLIGRLLALGGIVYAAILIDRRRRSVPATASAPRSDAAVIDAEILVGIAEVDPVPLSQVVEAMDPDATQHAHRDVQEQRDRLPVRGKNLR